MKNLIFALAMALALLLSPSMLSAADTGEVIFCESIDDKLEPVGPNTEFETNQVSLIIYAAERKPFGVLSVVLTIYKQHSPENQEIIHRENKEISPDWNVLAIKDIPLPDIGSYYVAVHRPDGQLASGGLVTIKEKTVEKEIPDENVVSGGNLKSLFETYKSKAVTTE